MGLSELGEGHGRSPWAETKSSLMEGAGEPRNPAEMGKLARSVLK
ncbi:hypothetical protein [Pelomicrobium sp. G1]|nr:MAG: hypothetical protein KatS3mg123_1073 [Burkholderiales bacterium]